MNNKYYESEITTIINAINKSDNNGNHFFVWPKGVSSTIINILDRHNVIVVPHNSTTDKYFEMKDSGNLVFTDNNTTVFAHKEKHEKYENDWSNSTKEIKSKYNDKLLSRNQKIVNSTLFK